MSRLAKVKAGKNNDRATMSDTDTSELGETTTKVKKDGASAAL